MRIVISGASGLIGKALVPSLEATGHEVVRLIRGRAARGPGESKWDPDSGTVERSVVANADAVINLSGRSIARGRWSAVTKSDLRSSRINSTRTLVEAVGASDTPPRVMINASAVGYYGDRGDEVLDETSPRGHDFLAELVGDWEAAALCAQSDRTRAAVLRLGMVIARGGALGRMLTPFKLGLGGPIGSGRQFWPWIGLDDVCGVIELVLRNEMISGPVNVVAPQELRCSDFTRTLGRVLSRPSVMPLPAFAARIALGEMADALLLSSQRVRPGVLSDAGYGFHAPSLDVAIRSALHESL
jgi:uncharacterized protein (TIGR01777 family)